MSNYTIFCDIGDVLIEVAPLMQQAAKLAAAQCAEDGFDIDPVTYTNVYLALDQATTRPHINHLFGDRRVAIAATERTTGTADLRYVGAFLTSYRQYIRSQIRPQEDISRFFRSLSGIGHVRLGVISDGTTDDQLEILARLRVLVYLDPALVIISEDFGKEKTSIDIYQEALRRCATLPNRTYMIGDNLQRDIYLAQTLGMRTVYFTKYKRSAPISEDVVPDHASPSFDDMAQFLHSRLVNDAEFRLFETASRG
jgi:HAD superfamily hydrolase (TIGR01549 family)